MSVRPAPLTLGRTCPPKGSRLPGAWVIVSHALGSLALLKSHRVIGSTTVLLISPPNLPSKAGEEILPTPWGGWWGDRKHYTVPLISPPNLPSKAGEETSVG